MAPSIHPTHLVLRFFRGERGTVIAKHGKICLVSRTSRLSPQPGEEWVCRVLADEGNLYRVMPEVLTHQVRWALVEDSSMPPILGIKCFRLQPEDPWYAGLNLRPPVDKTAREDEANAPYFAGAKKVRDLFGSAPIPHLVEQFGTPRLSTAYPPQLVWQHPTYGAISRRCNLLGILQAGLQPDLCVEIEPPSASEAEWGESEGTSIPATVVLVATVGGTKLHLNVASNWEVLRECLPAAVVQQCQKALHSTVDIEAELAAYKALLDNFDGRPFITSRALWLAESGQNGHCFHHHYTLRQGQPASRYVDSTEHTVYYGYTYAQTGFMPGVSEETWKGDSPYPPVPALLGAVHVIQDQSGCTPIPSPIGATQGAHGWVPECSIMQYREAALARLPALPEMPLPPQWWSVEQRAELLTRGEAVRAAYLEGLFAAAEELAGKYRRLYAADARLHKAKQDVDRLIALAKTCGKTACLPVQAWGQHVYATADLPSIAAATQHYERLVQLFSTALGPAVQRSETGEFEAAPAATIPPLDAREWVLEGESLQYFAARLGTTVSVPAMGETAPKVSPKYVGLTVPFAGGKRFSTHLQSHKGLEVLFLEEQPVTTNRASGKAFAITLIARITSPTWCVVVHVHRDDAFSHAWQLSAAGKWEI